MNGREIRRQAKSLVLNPVQIIHNIITLTVCWLLPMILIPMILFIIGVNHNDKELLVWIIIIVTVCSVAIIGNILKSFLYFSADIHASYNIETIKIVDLFDNLGKFIKLFIGVNLYSFISWLLSVICLIILNGVTIIDNKELAYIAYLILPIIFIIFKIKTYFIFQYMADSEDNNILRAIEVSIELTTFRNLWNIIKLELSFIIYRIAILVPVLFISDFGKSDEVGTLNTYIILGMTYIVLLLYNSTIEMYTNQCKCMYYKVMIEEQDKRENTWYY